MDAAVLIHAFRALPTSDLRREALELLTQELTPHQWRALQSLLNTRTFQFDIIGALPVELVAQIFSFLDPSTPFRLQVVSKRWKTVLRSLDVLKSGLKVWYDGTASFKGEDYDFCAQKARNIHRFRTGRHSLLETGPYRGSDSIAGSLVLFEDLLVGVGAAHRMLLVYNLRNGESWKTQAEARETILCVTASEHIVAYTTSLSMCYVSNISGGQKRKFKLPPNMVLRLDCRERTVICGGFFQDAARIYMWDFDSQKGKSIQLNYQAQPSSRCNGRDMAILPDLQSRSFTVFTNTSFSKGPDDDASCSIRYTRFNFDGCSIWNKELHLPEYASVNILSKVRPVDRRGGFALECLARPRRAGGLEQISLYFDGELQTFIDPHCPFFRGGPWVGARTSWFKDSFYQVLPDARTLPSDNPQYSNNESIILAHLGTSDHSRFRPLCLDQKLPDNDAHPVWQRDIRLLINDKWGVILDHSSWAEPSMQIIAFEERLTSN